MELLDIYNDEGQVTGRKIIRGDKSVILNNNEYIAVAVIYIENSNGMYLMQKTSKEKGGEFASTGGHIGSGETPLKTIKREVFEELGIDISNDDIKELGYIIYNKAIRYMFYLKKDINIEDIKVQKEEVEYAKYMTTKEIKNLIEKNMITKSHGVIFNEILKFK